MTKKRINVGSDFSGVGAFEEALKSLGINFITVFACDKDKHARKTYLANHETPGYFPEDVNEREIPEQPLDIYISSPPCQSFSLAGNRGGENDKRGVLFYNTHQFITKNRPRFFIIENVKGLLSDNKTDKKDPIGQTFKTWLDLLAGKSLNGQPVLFPPPIAAPYHIFYNVLNSKEHGQPQNRERVFIVGIRDDQDAVFTWPKTQSLNKFVPEYLEPKVASKYYLSLKAIKSLVLNPDIMQKPNINPLIANTFQSPGKSCGNYKGMNIIVKSSNSQGCEIARPADVQNKIATTFDHHSAQAVVLGYTRDSKGVVTSRHLKTACNTFHTATGTGGNTDQFIYINKLIRRLTPRECFKIMAFNDSFILPVDDTHLYKQVGNSIDVSLLAQIINKLNL